MTEDKAAAAVSHVKDHAALTCFEHVRLNFAGVIEQRHPGQECMRGDVARAKLGKHQFAVRTLRTKGSEVDHDRKLCISPSLQRALYRHPFGPAIVRGL